MEFLARTRGPADCTVKAGSIGPMARIPFIFWFLTSIALGADNMGRRVLFFNMSSWVQSVASLIQSGGGGRFKWSKTLWTFNYTICNTRNICCASLSFLACLYLNSGLTSWLRHVHPIPRHSALAAHSDLHLESNWNMTSCIALKHRPLLSTCVGHHLLHLCAYLGTWRLGDHYNFWYMNRLGCQVVMYT